MTAADPLIRSREDLMNAHHQATCWVWRDMDVWDRVALTPITVPPVTVNIGDRAGTRAFSVDADVFRVDLR